MWNKKTYQTIARAIYQARQTNDPISYLEDELSILFRQDNPNFNDALFIEACQTGKTKGMRS